jgi:hypothetical protein
MNLKLFAAAAAIAFLPAAALAQPKAPAPTKADAQKVVKLVSADKAKLKAYCDMAKLADEAADADKKKDNKKLEEISLKMDEAGKVVGPEFATLMDGLQDLDPNSKAAQDINTTLEDLDKQCGR